MTIVLARPQEVPDLKARGYREAGPSRFPGFIQMHLVPFEAPVVPDEETHHIAGAVAALGEEA
ncbi:MAG: hypothetical protein WC807_14635 [Hyphomicrobium sp.]|jgi:hypothetical protein